VYLTGQLQIFFIMIKGMRRLVRDFVRKFCRLVRHGGNVNVPQSSR
jgi:hypothetical protein